MPPNDESASQETAARAERAREARRALSGARRLVIKIGTNVLTRASGEMAIGHAHSLIEEIADLRREGRQVIVVSSGAISLGMHRLGLDARPDNLPTLQACAAIGQIRLMAVYEHAFRHFGLHSAQVLLTEEDFSDRERYLNLRNTLERLLEHGVIPIVNENDTVSTSEIEPHVEEGARRRVFGDNDRLSALVMSKLEAGLLILLSDVGGLYPEYASGRQPTEPLSVVEELTSEITAMAETTTGRGRGGMMSKLRSIEVALEAGGMAVIASGTEPGILSRILAGESVGTLFLPRERKASRKRWLAHATNARGRVRLNAGAVSALRSGKSSLLFAGVTAVDGEFQKGDVVALLSETGEEIGRGRVNYGSGTAASLVGRRSDEIAAKTGERPAEFIHRDNIVVHAAPSR